jgi:stage II sporulation protein E
MRDRCKAIDDIIKEINERVKILYRDSLEKDKLTVFSADYSALSRVISEAVNARQAENEENKELTMHALSMLGKYKNDFHTVSVWGKRKIRVFARLKTVSENTVGMREFKRIMEQCCGCSFANPSLKIEGKSMTITLNMRPVFVVEAASSRQSADGLPICGDSPSYFNGHDNYFYALISDGMGTGANAALTSGICEIFLHEMLEGGNRVDTSVNMLNAVIASKGNECSATVDIMELDLYSGSCTFLKSGAASSFILRGGSVYKLSARTMPLGILDEADTDLQRVRLEDGDTIFLVSDGAAPLENYDHLINIIKSTSDEDTPEELCKRVVDLTKKNSKDDVSCVAVKIKALK